MRDRRAIRLRPRLSTVGQRDACAYVTLGAQQRVRRFPVLARVFLAKHLAAVADEFDDRSVFFRPDTEAVGGDANAAQACAG